MCKNNNIEFKLKKANLNLENLDLERTSFFRRKFNWKCDEL